MMRGSNIEEELMVWSMRQILEIAGNVITLILVIQVVVKNINILELNKIIRLLNGYRYSLNITNMNIIYFLYFYHLKGIFAPNSKSQNFYFVP